MLQQDGCGVGGDDGDGAVDGGDDDPDEVQRDDDGDDFPSPGENFPGRISLPESSFSLGGFRPVDAAEYFMDVPPCLGFREADIREEATWGVDPGGHAIARRGT